MFNCSKRDGLQRQRDEGQGKEVDRVRPKTGETESLVKTITGGPVVHVTYKKVTGNIK